MAKRPSASEGSVWAEPPSAFLKPRPHPCVPPWDPSSAPGTLPGSGLAEETLPGPHTTAAPLLSRRILPNQALGGRWNLKADPGLVWSTWRQRRADGEWSLLSGLPASTSGACPTQSQSPHSSVQNATRFSPGLHFLSSRSHICRGSQDHRPLCSTASESLGKLCLYIFGGARVLKRPQVPFPDHVVLIWPFHNRNFSGDPGVVDGQQGSIPGQNKDAQNLGPSWTHEVCDPNLKRSVKPEPQPRVSPTS